MENDEKRRGRSTVTAVSRVRIQYILYILASSSSTYMGVEPCVGTRATCFSFSSFFRCFCFDVNWITTRSRDALAHVKWFLFSQKSILVPNTTRFSLCISLPASTIMIGSALFSYIFTLFVLFLFHWLWIFEFKFKCTFSFRKNRRNIKNKMKKVNGIGRQTRCNENEKWDACVCVWWRLVSRFQNKARTQWTDDERTNDSLRVISHWNERALECTLAASA